MLLPSDTFIETCQAQLVDDSWTLQHIVIMDKKSDIEIYQSADGETQVEATFDQETVWLNQEQLSHLFDRDRTVIGRHVRKLFKEGELEEEVVCADFARTTQHGAIQGKNPTYRKFSPA